MRIKTQAGPLAAVAVSGFLLAACSTTHVPQMNETDLSGNDFNHELAQNYKKFANFEAYDMYDWSDAVVYADKSMASAKGNPPMPDDMSSRNIDGENHVVELKAARVRLMQAFASGAKQKAPASAATAQANFDCWVEQQEEGWQVEHIAACKGEFWQAMLATEKTMEPVPVAMAPKADPKPEPKRVAQTVEPVTDEMDNMRQYPYLVFFDWDKSNLLESATDVLEQVVRRAKETGNGIHLVGHADTSGGSAYNMKLSQNRTEVVKRHLIAHGIPEGSITTRWVGESEPLVSTPDGVREPQNRWVGVDLKTQL
jgi:OOP family OmpA-OmpF porin